MKDKEIIFIVGPTAIKKSEVAYKLANSIGGRVINADSRQVYTEVPLITAQPKIPKKEENMFSMYGYVSLNDNYSLVRWRTDILTEIANAFSDNLTPILVGGTAMYVNALIEGISFYPKIENKTKEYVSKHFSLLGRNAFYNYYVKKIPELKNIHINDTYRLIRDICIFVQTNKTFNYFLENKKTSFNFYYTCYVVLPNREQMYNCINNRFIEMINNGIIEEVETLIKSNLIHNNNTLTICGVREIFDYLKKKISLKEAIDLAQRNTRRYAKRQLTWFRNKFSNAINVSNAEAILNFYE